MVSSDRIYYWETYADNSLDYISSAFLGFTDKESAVKQFYAFIAEINTYDNECWEYKKKEGK
jgi:hypothetical protein